MTLTVAVREELASDADLPERLVNGRVYLDPDAYEYRYGGLPRPVRDLLGRVTSAAWADDDQIEVEVTFAHEWFAQLVDEGMAELQLAARMHRGAARDYFLLGVPVRG